MKTENKMASAANDYPGAWVKGADFGAGASKRRKEGERRVMLKFHQGRFSTIPLKQSKAAPGKKEQMKAQSSKMIGGILAVGVGIGGILALNLTLPPSVGTGHAQGLGQQPSAKVTAKTSNVVLIGPTANQSDYVTVLCNNIKTANMKDLFITAALEVGLFTRTEVPPEAQAKAGVNVRVLLDGQQVEPGVVVYGRRIQTLRADQTIELQLESLDAASFSFVAVDVPVGVHQICVQARVETGGAGNFSAEGAVGKGTMTVESVRLIKGEDVANVD